MVFNSYLITYKEKTLKKAPTLQGKIGLKFQA